MANDLYLFILFVLPAICFSKIQEFEASTRQPKCIHRTKHTWFRTCFEMNMPESCFAKLDRHMFAADIDVCCSRGV